MPEPGQGEDVIRGGVRGAAQHRASESEQGEEAVCVGKWPTGVSEPSRVSGIGQARAVAGASLGVGPQVGGEGVPTGSGASEMRENGPIDREIDYTHQTV